MAGFEHLLKTYDVGDLLDDVASADPPAYLHRCFAEAISTPSLSLSRLQQLAACAMVLDSILNERDYSKFEPELIADWRMHYLANCIAMKDLAAIALHRAIERFPPDDADAAAELVELLHRLAPV